MTVSRRTNADGTTSYRAVIYTDGSTVAGKWSHDRARAEADERDLISRREADRLVRSAEQLEGYLEADVRRREQVSKRGTPLAGTTAIRYREAHARICAVMIGRRPAGTLLVGKITPRIVEQIVAGLTARGLKAPTVRQDISRLATALERAVRDGVLPSNPASATVVDRPAGGVEQAPHDIGDRAPVILAAAIDDDVHPYLDVAVHLALLAGLRLSEICGLRWSAVDLEAGTIHVREVRTRAEARRGAKSAAGVRHAPITPQLAAALRRQQNRQLERLGGVAETVIDRRGRQWSNPPSISQAYRKLALAHGFGDVTFHDLRHGCTQILIAAGYTDRQIMQMLGWSRAAMVAHYGGTRLAPSEMQSISAAIDEQLERRRR